MRSDGIKLGLNQLQSLICTYSADDLRPLMEFATLRYQYSRNGTDNNNNKLSNSCKKNPRLGHKHRYVKFRSNGLKATRSGLSSS